ncbi:M56 family metallopeptidase [Aquimarina gracilis]|uniref:M56 family metallopeptidase n=1 Tax=Aquimarina gracilis TaxID=874422 RepID=A0ABU5ZZ13_9FLAO|nr:M56 family metallopeptidase [Aquimarina gracilis]MEB3347155.1 M56 family metallopeptidase [Aquimarina gracilis]
MIHYILQILALQLLFLLVYDLFLKKETFFNGNRVYLVATPLLSFILPLIKIRAIRQNIPKEYLIELPEILINKAASQEILLPEVIIGGSESFFKFITLSTLIQSIWLFGAVLSMALFFYKIYKVLLLKKAGTKRYAHDFAIVSLPNTNTAFTFFKTVFVGELLSEEKRTNILLHEKTHVSQYHSIDLVFFEILRIIFWFNPLVYIYQNRVATLQEYIADAKAIAETSKKEYYQDLLSQIFQTEKISFINTFFNHSLIKNRIVMLQKSKSKKIFQLKYLLLVPVIATMLIYSSCSTENNSPAEEKNQTEDTFITDAKALIAKIESEGEFSTDDQRLFGKLLEANANSTNGVTPEEKKVFEALINVITKHHKPTTKLKENEIPFVHLEKVPGYPGCEGLTNTEAKKCFTKSIQNHVAKEFNVKAVEGLEGTQRVYVRFKINETGNVVDIQARGPKKELEDEAIRVIKTLPQMTPGEQEGKVVNVMYSLPIVYKVQ